MTQHVWLPYWLTHAGHRAPIDDGAALKHCLQALGFRSRVFKLYMEYGDNLFRPLGPTWISARQPATTLRNVLEYLRLLQACEVDIAPPPILVSALPRCRLPSGSIAALPVDVFRGAWRALVQAGYAGRSAAAFVEREFVPVVCWFFESKLDRSYDGNRGKAGWSWLCDRWTAEKHRRALPPSRREWSAPVNDAALCGYRFLALVSEAALDNEGEVMRHCIARYVEPCREGHFHIFSIREIPTMERAATLALAGDGKKWAIVGLKAEGNADPDPKVRSAVMQFVRGLSRFAPPLPAPSAMLGRVLDRIGAING